MVIFKTRRACISTELMSQVWEKRSSPRAANHGHLHRQACHHPLMSGWSHRSLWHNANITCTMMCHLVACALRVSHSNIRAPVHPAAAHSAAMRPTPAGLAALTMGIAACLACKLCDDCSQGSGVELSKGDLKSCCGLQLDERSW